MESNSCKKSSNCAFDLLLDTMILKVVSFEGFMPIEVAHAIEGRRVYAPTSSGLSR